MSSQAAKPTDEESPFHTLFRRWSQIADRTLAGSLFRRYAPYEDAGPYKPSPPKKAKTPYSKFNFT